MRSKKEQHLLASFATCLCRQRIGLERTAHLR